MNYTMHDLPLDDRPRERLLQHGIECLSTAELLAIILVNGTKGASVLHLAQELLSKFGSLNNLLDTTVEELCQIKGLGKAKAVQIKAACALGLRLTHQISSQKYRITTPQQAYFLIKDELEPEKREFFVVLLQDAKGYLILKHTVSIGTLSETLVHPREVFYPAIRHKAASVILAHNHPSGDPEPSEKDISITKTLIETGKVLGIPVQDHIIIGSQSYVSLRQKKLLFNENFSNNEGDFKI